MLIWSGWGFVVPVITFAILILFDFATSAYFGDESYYADNAWPKFTAMLLAAIVVWFLGRYLNGGKGRVVVDQETQEQLILKRTHTFFWLRIEYWAPLLILLGIVLAFV